MTKKLSVAEAKAHLSEVLARVHGGGERFIIEKRGKPVAAVVPLEALSLEERLEADDWLGALLKLGRAGEALGEELERAVRERAERPGRAVNLGGGQDAPA